MRGGAEMIMTVTELRKHINTDKTDEVLIDMLAGVEQSIRAYTNNHFHTDLRIYADIKDNKIIADSIPFLEGDTIEVIGTPASDGLYTVALDDVINEPVRDCENAVLRLVLYPADVKHGAVSLIAYSLENEGKAGISSETISRHSVTYKALNDNNSVMGYPLELVAFLKPHRRARF